ncbi:hypothetical protein EDD85DRAFT_862448 [Armillaria nabsnona]|nr:hypothetical protein EDD85DRAFT_862448 [Armillaria nabsnona]
MTVERQFHETYKRYWWLIYRGEAFWTLTNRALCSRHMGGIYKCYRPSAMPTEGNEITGRSQAGIHKPNFKVSICERSFLSPIVLAPPSVMDDVVGKPPPKRERRGSKKGAGSVHVRTMNDTETDDDAFSDSDDEVLHAYEKRWRILSSVTLQHRRCRSGRQITGPSWLSGTILNHHSGERA